MEQVIRDIVQGTVNKEISLELSKKLVGSLQELNKSSGDDIAIIGVALNIADTDCLRDYFDIFENNIDCIRDFPKGRIEKINGTSKRLQHMLFGQQGECQYYNGSYNERIDEFDYKFFNLSPREASLMDPVQRLLLQNIMRTFDDAGYLNEKIKGSKTGVFIGYDSTSIKDMYYTHVTLNDPELLKYALIGNLTAIVPSRASHHLDLKGPTMVFDTACSSSLVAIHEACRSIKENTCDMAVAGGIKINLCPLVLDNMRIGFETEDGRTRAFDNNSCGANIGEGVATILLKPLKQAKKDYDHIYAVIKGTAINNDGNSSGITVPNPGAQTSAIIEAWKEAHINPEDISYIETHGTGTGLGDPIEIQGLQNAFKKVTDKKQFCAIGSSKSNVGHLYEAAGMASLLKMVGALVYKKLPGTKHYNVPNQKINLLNSSLYVNTQTKDWKVDNDKLRLCGVSGFGLSGTNCHIVLQEYKEDRMVESKEMPGVLCVSAKERESLVMNLEQYMEFIKDSDAPLAQIVYNINKFRTDYTYRTAIVYKDRQDLLERMEQLIQSDLTEKSRYLYYGYKQEKVNHEQQSRMNQVVQNINQYLTKERQEESHDFELLLCEFAQNYCMNVKVDWDVYYQNITMLKIAIPAYAFVKNSVWMPIIEKAEEDAIEEAESVDVNKKYSSYVKNFILRDQKPEQDELDKCLYMELDAAKNDVLYQELRAEFQDVTRFTFSLPSAMNEEVFRIKMVSFFKKLDLNHYSHIIYHVGERFIEGENGTDFYEYQKHILLPMIYFYQVLVEKEQELKRNVSFIAVTKETFCVDGERDFSPDNATLFGFGKAFNRRFKKMHFVCLDVLENAETSEILHEIQYKHTQDIVVLRRQGAYIESLKEFNMDEEENPEEIPVRDGGVYLVTGGLGGIGFETMKKFTELGDELVFVVLARSELPLECSMEELEQAGVSKAVRTKVSRLSEIKEICKDVMYCVCDVTKKEDVASVCARVKEKYGTINGVIHAAGNGGECEVEYLQESRLRQILGTKVQGAYYLDQETKDLELDFFLMYSSISTVFSSSELADYIAGNCYLDQFCYYRNKNRKGITLTVNWATWIETGMSVEQNFSIDTLFKGIKTKQGMSLLCQALSCHTPNIILAELNLDSKICLLLKKYPMVLSEYIESFIEKAQESSVPKKADSAPAVKDNQYSAVESQVSKVCCKILGYDEVSITDNFFELGADSILLKYIFNELSEIYPNTINIVDLFEFPTIYALSEHIASSIGEKGVVANEVPETGEEAKGEAYEEDDIAIIGIGMYMPGATNLEDYWDMLHNGICNVVEMKPERRNDLEKHFLKMGMKKEDIVFTKGGYLDEINKFDYSVFGISPREACIMEPVNRLFLQSCNTALEDAGYAGESIKGSDTGVFLGYTAHMGNAYSRLLYDYDKKLFGESLTVNQSSMAASRISYIYDLKGPSMVIDTACSSSLVALHMACEQVRTGKCSMALAGGASIACTPLANGYSVGFESPEEKTRAFSEDSTGTAIGEGVAALLIKRAKKAVEDHDDIYAIIKGTATNQDGSSNGIAAPNYKSQADVIRTAWKNARINPEDICYIEAHGTGTQLGDTIEIKGIHEAFSNVTDKKEFCGVGSVKTSIGHLNEASGMSGVLKIIGSYKYGAIPKTLHYNVPNPQIIDMVQTPLYVLGQELKLNQNKDNLIGLSGFGFSGTNCHVIFSNPPKRKYVEEDRNGKKPVFLLSARSKDTLLDFCDLFIDYFEKHPDVELWDVCSTIANGRRHYNYRFACQAESIEVLKKELLRFKECQGHDYETSISHFASYSIVSESKQNRTGTEFTKQEWNAANREAQEVLRKDNVNKDSLLAQLVSLYIRGAEIDWSQYFNVEYNRIHVPTYPYEKKYCWYSIEDVDFNEEEKVDDYFYYKKWIPDNRETEQISVTQQETFLLFYDRQKKYCEVGEEIRRKGYPTIEVYYGKGYQKTDEKSYCVDETVGSLTKLFEDLKDKNVTRILHMESILFEAKTQFDRCDERIDIGFYQIINMVKAMSKAHFNNKMEFDILVNEAYCVSDKDSVLHPENAVTASIGKVLEQEHTNISCRAIDIDEATNAAAIAEEVFRKEKVYLVAYRQNQRYVEVFDSADVVSKTDRIKEHGTYIVTGGTSGIGLEIVKYLSVEADCNIAVISRSGFPEESKWEQLKEDETYKERIRIFDSVKKNGCNLSIYSGNVADYEQMSKIFKDIRNKYGKIHGIFHSAGISGAGYILRKEKESFQRVLDPKVHGAINIHRLTEKEPLDFLLVCSSAVTDSGEAGQSDYVGANSFLDAFADYRNHLGLTTFCTNWVSWKETGMSVRFGINVDLLTKAITTQEAISCLDRLIKSDYRRVIVGQYNITADFANMLQFARSYMAERLENRLNRATEKLQQSNSSSFKRDNHEFAQIKDGKMIMLPFSTAGQNKSDVEKTKVTLTGDYQDSYSDVEMVLGDIYSKILGYDEVDVFENFFEMGGDSVMLTKMHGLIDARYPDFITVADLFEYTCLRTLAKHIEELLQENSVQEAAVTVSEPEEIMEDRTYEMSNEQERIIAANRMSKNKLVYSNPFLMRLDGWDDDCIRQAIDTLVRRHESLRTDFCIVGGKMKQIIHAHVDYQMQTYDVEDIFKEDYLQYMEPFKLKAAPLFRIKVFKDSKNQKAMLFDIHHSICDGMSSSILQSEIKKLMVGEKLEKCQAQYHDYVEYEMKFRRSSEWEELKQYWDSRMGDYKKQCYIPCKSEEIQSDSYQQIVEIVRKPELDAIKEYTRKQNITLYHYLIGCLDLALYSLSGKKELMIGTVAMNRQVKKFMNVVGMFSNVLPNFMMVDDTQTVKEYFEIIKNNIIGDLRHQSYPYSEILRKYQKENNRQDEVFDVYFDYESESFAVEEDNASYREQHYDYLQYPKFPVSICAVSEWNNCQINVKYYDAMYEGKEVRMLVDRFIDILGMVKDESVDKKISDFVQKL